MESDITINSHVSREDRINKLLEKAKHEGLSSDSFAIWEKLKALAQSEFSLSSAVARDYAGVVIKKLPVKDKS